MQRNLSFYAKDLAGREPGKIVSPANGIINPLEKTHGYGRLRHLNRMKRDKFLYDAHPPLSVRWDERDLSTFIEVLESCGRNNRKPEVEPIDQTPVGRFDPRAPHFDVILIDLTNTISEMDLFAHGIQASGSLKEPISESSFYSDETASPQFSFPRKDMANLPMESLAGRPGWLFLWVGQTKNRFEARQIMSSWGFRKIECIGWMRTDGVWGVVPDGDGSCNNVFQGAVEWCIVGLKGSAKRTFDSQLIHCNLDTDVIVCDGPEAPICSLLSNMIENFSLGQRRLHLFARPGDERPGWVTVGRNLERTTFDCRRYLKTWDNMGRQGWLSSPDAEIEYFRPKTPPIQVRRRDRGQIPWKGRPHRAGGGRDGGIDSLSPGFSHTGQSLEPVWRLMTPPMRENYKLYRSSDRIGVLFSQDGGDTIYTFPSPPGLPQTKRLPPQDGKGPPTDLRVYQLSRNTRRNRAAPKAPPRFVEEPLVPLWSSRSQSQSQSQKSILGSPVITQSQMRLEAQNSVQESPVECPSQEMPQSPEVIAHEMALLSLLKEKSQQPVPFTVNSTTGKPDLEPDSWNVQSLPPSSMSAFSSDLSLPSLGGSGSYKSSLSTGGPPARPRQRFGPSKYPPSTGGQYGNVGARPLPFAEQLGLGLPQNGPLLAGGLSPITPRYYDRQPKLSTRNPLYRSSSADMRFNPTVKYPPFPGELPGVSTHSLSVRSLSPGVQFNPPTKIPSLPNELPAHKLLAKSLSTGVQFGPRIRHTPPPDEQSRTSAHTLLAKSLSSGVRFSPAIRSLSPPSEQTKISAHSLLAKSLSAGVQFSPPIKTPSPPEEKFRLPTNLYEHMNDSGSRQLKSPPPAPFQSQSGHVHALVPGAINSPIQPIFSSNTTPDYRRLERTNAEAGSWDRAFADRPLGPRHMPEKMASRPSQPPQTHSQIPSSTSVLYGSNTHQVANRMGPPAASSSYYPQPQGPNAFRGPRDLPGPSIRNGDRQFFPQPLRRGFGYPDTSHNSTRTQILGQRKLSNQKDYLRDENGNFIVDQPGDEPQFRTEERHQLRAECELAKAYADHQAQVQSQLAMAQSLMSVVPPNAPIRLMKARNLVALAGSTTAPRGHY